MRSRGWNLIAVLAVLMLAEIDAAFAADLQPSAWHESLMLASGQMAAPDAQGRLRYIVRFSDPGVRERQARREFAEPVWTDPRTRAILSEMVREQDVLLSGVGHALGRSLQPTHRYLTTQSGVALWLWPEEAKLLAEMPEVVSVQPDRVFTTETYRGPEFIGAGAIWSGSAVPDERPLLGEGMVVAIIDSGILDPLAHQAFANDPACGHGVGGTPDKLISALDCASASQGLCDGPDAFDHNSHGSHVAATAAGNRLLEGQTSPALNVPGDFDAISGVAPCAHIRSYKVCPGRSCFFSHIAAAIESILLHADVDVANYSISGGNAPWNDLDRPKLELVDAGVLVAASAGNSGPEASTVSHRGPWLVSVAASTRDANSAGGTSRGDVLAGFSSRGPTPAPFQNIQKPDLTAPGLGIFAVDVIYRASISGPGAPPPSLQDISLSPGSGTQRQTAPFANRAILFDPDQDPAADGCQAFPEDFFAGAVALIRRGTCTFVEKIDNALDAGASLVLIHNNAAGNFSLGTGDQPTSIDAFGMSGEAGETMRDFIAAAGGAATIDFIIPPGFGFKSGTSMSSPHVAGAALLVRQARPDWTPMEVASALRMSAERIGFKQDGSTPWDWDDVGSGRVDLGRAALAGLVMDETMAAFLAADPALDGDVRMLNLPALRDADCWPDCTFVRTVRNALDVPSQWHLAGQSPDGAFEIATEPSIFHFTGDPSETQRIEITVRPLVDTGRDAFEFGSIILAEQSGLSPELHWSVAIVSSRPPLATVAPGEFSFSLTEDGQATDTVMLGNIGESDLVFRIASAEVAGQVTEFGSIPGVDESGQDNMSAPIELRIDSGIAVPIGAGEQQLVWFNRLTPRPLDLPFTLEEIRVGWAPGVGLKSISLPQPPEITAADGDLLVAVVSRERIKDYFPAIRDDASSKERSWLAFQFPGGVAGDPPEFSQAGSIGLIEELNAALAGNWTIRAYGTGGSACLEPGDVPWLSVSPESGTVGPGSAQAVDITINMAGLGGGIFEARLCIETNDPDQPVIVVPIMVEVEGDLLAPPALIYGPTSFAITLTEGRSASRSLMLGNAGGQDLFWTVDAESENCRMPDWLLASPLSGQLPAGNEQEVLLQLDAADLVPGDYAAVLCIDHTDPDRSRIELPVQLEVTPLVDPVFHDRFEQ